MRFGHFPAPFCRRFALLVLLLTTCVAPRIASAAFECKDDGWEGTSEFLALARAVAGADRVRLLAEIDYGAIGPEDSILIFHPEVILDDLSLVAFIQQGGRVAVLDDFGKSITFSDRFGIQRVPVPADPQTMLRGNRHLSVGTPVETPSPDGAVQTRHPLVADVEQVMLNHPSGVTNPGLTPLLEVRSKNGTATTVALTGVVGSAPQGRLLVMSDPSAFINLMIRYPGNMAFARALIKYLTDSDRSGGKGRLYIVANRFEQTGRFSKNRGTLDDIAEALEHLVRELQNGLPPPVLVLLAALSTLAIARWIATNAWRKPSPATPRYLRPTPPIAQAGWPGRAAALASATTHAAVLLVELREAFRSRLTQLICADPTASSQELVATIESRGLLPPELLHSLRELLAGVDAAEKAVLARKPIRIGQARVADLLKQSLDILDHISQVERPRRESSPSSQ